MLSGPVMEFPMRDLAFATLLTGFLAACVAEPAPAGPGGVRIPPVGDFAALSEPNMRPVVDELVSRGCLVEVVENQFDPGPEALREGHPCGRAVPGADMREVARLATDTLNRGRSMEQLIGDPDW